jgi:hypothetical protein
METTKICQSCYEIKPLLNFQKYKLKNGFGYRNYCKECTSKYKKELYERNKVEILTQQKEYRLNNYNKVRAADNQYKKKNRKALSDKQKIYAKNNAEKIKQYKRKWEKDKMINDPLFKCKKSIMNLIRKSFARDGLKKSKRTNDILGCTYDEFKQYLEKQFEPWMTWNNYGMYNGQPEYGWDIDHIVPLKITKTEDDIIKLCHYTNLQPLCSYYNRVIKGSTLNQPHPILSERSIV